MYEYIFGALHINNILWNMIGLSLGVIIGALPGLGPALGIALLSPLTFGMKPDAALIFLGGFTLPQYGGSISAILVKAPGTGGNAATVLDGYPMTQQGKAKTALGASLMASCVGGFIGVVVLIFMAPLLASVGLAFGPSEYFLLAVLALVATASVGKGRQAMLKGLLGAVIGLLLTTIGWDIIVGYPRFVFGFQPLSDGIELLPAMIGLFAVSEAIRLAVRKETAAQEITAMTLGGSWREGLAAPLKKWWTTIRSALIGTFMGALPGAGIAAANFLSYLVEMRSSKNPGDFGKGKIEGVIAAESSNNACEGGSFIPTMALAIPGNATTAIMLGTLMMHGLRPGPKLLVESANVVYTFFGGLLLANILMLFVGFLFMSQFSRIVNINKGILIPLIAVLCFIGSYLTRQEPFDIIVALLFGLLGVFCRRYQIPLVTLVMGLILGELIEQNLFRAIKVLDNPLLLPVSSKICIILTIAIIIIAFYPSFIRVYRKFAGQSRVEVR